MALDFSKVISQISKMAAGIKANQNKELEQLHRAVEFLHNQSDSWVQLSKKINSSKTTWLVAGLVRLGSTLMAFGNRNAGSFIPHREVDKSVTHRAGQTEPTAVAAVLDAVADQILENFARHVQVALQQDRFRNRGFQLQVMGIDFGLEGIDERSHHVV